ncbi:MAG: SHOCT domain-containing protein, partial [Ornithinibacter sp.]
GGWALMGLAMVMFWGAVAYGLVVLLRPSSRASGGGAPSIAERMPEKSSALRTLDERFARGDMTEEEYRQRRDLLKGS